MSCAVAEAARRDKEDKYPEFLCSQRCALVVVAVETGGRWSQEAADFVEELAFAGRRMGETAANGVCLEYVDDVVRSMLNRIKYISGVGQHVLIVLLTPHGDVL